ncbi:MAG: hypothetical protein ACLU00_02900 [Mediterraneibacter faecis]
MEHIISETGYGIRPSKVVYDRKHSAFSEYDFGKADFEKILDGYTWLHLSGITPALGKSCSEMILTCLKIAKEKKMTVSFDGNFRSTLGVGKKQEISVRCVFHM